MFRIYKTTTDFTDYMDSAAYYSGSAAIMCDFTDCFA